MDIDDIIRRGLESRRQSLENALKWADRHERNSCGRTASEQSYIAREAQSQRGAYAEELRQVKTLLDTKAYEQKEMKKPKPIKRDNWYSGAG